MSVQTKDYVQRLINLKLGERSLLRTLAGQGLDESVHGFDLFAGIWWPLRQKSAGAPRREVAWLVAKLHAACPLEHREGEEEEFHLARQLAQCAPPAHEEEGKALKRFIRRFDRILRTRLQQLEPDLLWALNTLREHKLPLDWVSLTDHISQWERTQQRYKWSQIFTNNLTGEHHAD